MGKIYDNIALYAPNGTLLSYISKRRAKWYIKKGLTSKHEEGLIVLNFEPNGYGEPDEKIYKKENKCVVCGTSDNLTRHHAVPYAFRKHFPEAYKSNNSSDVVALCRNHHNEYELIADKEKKELFKRVAKKELAWNLELTKVKKALADLDFFEIMDPLKAFEKNESIKEFVLKHNIDRQEIKSAKIYQPEVVVIEKIGIESVVRLFKNHFEKTMNCKYLPQGWDANEVKVTNRFEVDTKSDDFYCVEWVRVGFMCETQCSKCEKTNNFHL